MLPDTTTKTLVEYFLPLTILVEQKYDLYVPLASDTSEAPAHPTTVELPTTELTRTVSTPKVTVW